MACPRAMRFQRLYKINTGVYVLIQDSKRRTSWPHQSHLLDTFVSPRRHRDAQALGIEAQREALSNFAQAENFELVRVFVEVETGKGSDALGAPSKALLERLEEAQVGSAVQS